MTGTGATDGRGDPTDLGVDAELARAADAIRSIPRGVVALACHINPDGDALGSMLGLHHALRAAGIPSIASFSEPFVVAPHYRELPGLELLSPPDRFPHDPAVMVTFDSGTLGRLGDLEAPAKAAGELIVIDHHVSNQRYGTINVIDPKAAASGVLVRRLIEQLQLPLTRDSAVCLYTALVCDTGRFQYESTTPAVFELARARGVRSPDHRAVAHAVRGAPLRVPPAARRRAHQRSADHRQAVRVDEGEPGRPRAPRRDVRGGRGAHRRGAAHAGGRGVVRAQGSVGRDVARQPPFAGSRRRSPHRRTTGRRRASLRRRLHQRRTSRRDRREDRRSVRVVVCNRTDRGGRFVADTRLGG